MGVEEWTQAQAPGLEDDSMSESQQRAEERMRKWRRGMEKVADSWMNGKMTSATRVPGIPHHAPIIKPMP